MKNKKSEDYVEQYKKSKLFIDLKKVPEKLTKFILFPLSHPPVKDIKSKLMELRKLTDDIEIMSLFLFVVDYIRLKDEETNEILTELLLGNKINLRKCATGIPAYKCKKCNNIAFSVRFDLSRRDYLRKEFSYCTDCEKYSDFSKVN